MEHYFSKLKNTVRECWNSPALSDLGGDTFTFAELAVEIENIHKLYCSIGLMRGNKVAICAKNCSRWAISFLATTTYNAVAVPILYDLTPDSILKLVVHSGSRILLTDRQLFQSLDTISCSNIEVILDIDGFNPLYCNDNYKKIQIQNLDRATVISRNAVNYPDENNDSEIAVINYTSGTTGDPKGVMLRHGSFSHMIEFAQRHVKAEPGDSLVSMLPMAHMYGLMFELLYPLISGVHITYLCRVPSPTMLVKTMKEIKPYMMVTVPVVLEKIYGNYIKPALLKPIPRLVSKIPVAKQALYSTIRKKIISNLGGNIRYFIVGGAALNPEVEKSLKTIGLPYTVGYGMTEACPLLAFSEYNNFVQGSCGRKIDGIELKIDSVNPYDTPGEILVKGPTVFSGYYNNQEATEAAFTENGFFRTGDLGIIDQEGNIFIKGRCKTMILSANGQNIYPEEVESVINSQDEVMESVVVDRGGKLVALVCLDCNYVKEASLSDGQITDIPKVIREVANTKLPKFSQLSKVEIRMEPFEKTPKMSIKRFLYK